MPLTNEQIETLFAFTKKKSVQYYDLQVELVDHLASSIEEEMEKDTKLSFENALQKVYSRFGLFGFAHVVQEREKALWKQSWKLFWKTLGSHFTVPKISLTLLLFISAYLLAPFVPAIAQRIIITVIFVYSAVVDIQTLRQRVKTDIKPLLLSQASRFFIPLPISSAWVVPDLINWKTTPVHSVAFAVVITLLVVLHLTAVQIDKQIRRKAKELYPEAFSVA